MNRRDLIKGAGIAAVVASGCGRDRPSVVVYSSLDPEFSGAVLADYAARTGVDVIPKFDVESTKSVGLTRLIVQEASRPRCDVFWNNEILNTIRLGAKGLLRPYMPEHAADVPAGFKAADGSWYGFAARARVFLVNNRSVPEPDRPRGLADLLDLRWKGKVGIAKPLFGSTATHAACLFAHWGETKASDYFRGLKANGVRVFSGNKQVATATSSGEIAIGLTDTDDATGEVEAGQPVAMLYPDRAPDALGTLFIPNTIAVIRGCPHPEEAVALASAILAPGVEATLAAGAGALIPILASGRATARIETPKTVRAMPVDFEAAARAWDATARFLEAEFTAA